MCCKGNNLLLKFLVIITQNITFGCSELLFLKHVIDIEK